jgi:hypothetical protein
MGFFSVFDVHFFIEQNRQVRGAYSEGESESINGEFLTARKFMGKERNNGAHDDLHCTDRP